MATERIKNLWVPYIVTIIGILLSLALAIVFWINISAYFLFLQSIRQHLPWLTLVIGSALSFLLAALIRATQRANEHSKELDVINENLKNEIAERTQIEASKQELEAALLQGQKLQAMGTLAGGIAHDFNNLLYAIIGYTEMAREDVQKDTQLFHNLGKILEATTRGQELVARILSFSRKQHQQLEPINLNKTIDTALALLRPTIPAGVSIEFSSKHDATILGNQTQLHQVLVNLINNSVDAMDGEGTISIHVKEADTNDPIFGKFPSLKASAKKFCQLEISDTGQGMNKQTLERIFEPFYTTKEVGKGTGLGLSIVHTIIRDHGGGITVSSQLGKGTTFIILFLEYTHL